MGELLGRLSYRINTRAAKVTRVNIGLCLPEESQELLTRNSLIATGKTVMETPAVWFGSSDEVDRWITTVHNEGLITEALEAETGTLVLLPHLGNWELFNVAFRRYGRMTALFQPPRHPGLQPVMSAVRARHGNQMVPANRRGVATLYKTLQAGGTVVVLPDQIPANGSYTSFFAQSALTDVLSARLLQKTGARAVGAAMIRQEDGRFELHFLAPESGIYDRDVNLATRAVNGLVEQAVMRAPDQYQWEYKRFRERPVGEPKVYRFNKPPGVH